MLKTVIEERALNQVWKSACFHSINSVLSLFRQRRRLGILGIVRSEKDSNVKNCIAFYGRLRKQAYSKFAAECSKNLYHPDLRAEYYVEVQRFDNGIPRKSRYLITE